MTYEMVDPILEKWAKDRDLPVQKKYQDVEVRSINIVSPRGNRYQLWIDVPSKNGDTEVHVWDFSKKRKDFPASIDSLEQALDSAYQCTEIWES